MLSNFDERLHKILQDLDLRQYFDAIFVSSEIGHEKPNIEAFEFVRQSVQPVLRSTECVHVGDCPTNDGSGAVSAGWRAVLVAPNSAGLTSDPSLGVSVISSLEHLPSDLSQLH